MNRLSFFAPVICLLGLALAVNAQENKTGRPYPPSLPGAEVETYKTVGDAKLNLYV